MAKLLIRFAAEADAPSIAAIYAPYVTETPITFETEPPDAAEIAHRIEKTSAQYPYLVCTADGEVVAYAYAGLFRTRAAYGWDVETSVYVRGDSHRKGIASALYIALLDLLKAQGFYNVYAGITTPNEKSEGFHQKFGFADAGVWHRTGFKMGRWHDVRMMEKFLVEGDAQPKPIIGIRNLDEGRKAAALAKGNAALRG